MLQIHSNQRVPRLVLYDEDWDKPLIQARFAVTVTEREAPRR
jgi:hypothetical protein